MTRKKKIIIIPRKQQSWISVRLVTILNSEKLVWSLKRVPNLFMTERLLRFKAGAAIPAARPRALSAGYTSDKFPLILRRGPEKSYSFSGGSPPPETHSRTINEAEPEPAKHEFPLFFLFFQPIPSTYRRKGDYSRSAHCDVGIKEIIVCAPIFARERENEDKNKEIIISEK